MNPKERLRSAFRGALVITGQLNLATPAGREAFEELRFYDRDGSLELMRMCCATGAAGAGHDQRSGHRAGRSGRGRRALRAVLAAVDDGELSLARPVPQPAPGRRVGAGEAAQPGPRARARHLRRTRRPRPALARLPVN